MCDLRARACVRARCPPIRRGCDPAVIWRQDGSDPGATRMAGRRPGVEFHCIIYTLFASLTGLPAHLTGAAPVSRVCQVFGGAKRLTVTRPAAQRRAPTHIPLAIGRFRGGPASSVSFAKVVEEVTRQVCHSFSVTGILTDLRSDSFVESELTRVDSEISAFMGGS